MINLTKSSGVTLVELVLVIVIVSIITVFAGQYFELKTINNSLALEKLKMALDHAQQIAKASGCNVKINNENGQLVFMQKVNCNLGDYKLYPHAGTYSLMVKFNSTPIYNSKGKLQQDLMFLMQDKSYVIDAETSYVYQSH